jgi:hypothetical protein
MTTTRRALLGGFATAALAALAPTRRALALAGDGSNLAPGQYIWEPELSTDGPVVIIVSLPDQLCHVYRNGIEIGISTVSTGMPGHVTPTGVFTILAKDKDHHSSVYNEASMPNSERLTWDGVALHAGGLPGYPSSHGCIHLPLAFSAVLYGITNLGTPVIICDDKSEPAVVTHPGIVLSDEAGALASAAMVKAAGQRQNPPDATTKYYDVMSGLVSAADKAVYLFVDGEIAWQSPITITDPHKPLGNQSYTLLGPSENGQSIYWFAHGIHGDTTVNTAADRTLSRIHVAQSAEARAILEKANKGSTLVVTDLPAGPDTRTGTDFVILA